MTDKSSILFVYNQVVKINCYAVMFAHLKIIKNIRIYLKIFRTKSLKLFLNESRATIEGSHKVEINLDAIMEMI